MRYASVCSGVEAATIAWIPLGWKAVFFSEIEPFPAAVLAHHYPVVPNLGDMTKITGEDYIGKIDLLTGGTPCQSFSFAGLRRGLDDPRGNLCLKSAELAHRSSVRWILWENVPGVLSSNGGADFAGFLSLLCGWNVSVPADRKGVRRWKNAGIINPAAGGFGLAWRVLDAQYTRVAGFPRAVPQRRRRVFVVGYRGEWTPAAAVLFDRYCLSWNPSPRRQAGQGAARTITASTGCASAKEQQYNFINENGKPLNPLGVTWWNGKHVADTLTCTSNGQRMPDSGRMHAVIVNSKCPPSVANGGPMCCGFDSSQYGCNCNLAGTITTEAKYTIADRSSVRRLMPVECERLMGFPDNYTRIPWRNKPAELCPDSHRYKACGNSQCVNVMRWIGQRIDHIDKLLKTR